MKPLSEKEIKEEVLENLENKKVYDKKWNGKYSLYFKEEFEIETKWK